MERNEFAMHTKANMKRIKKPTGYTKALGVSISNVHCVPGLHNYACPLISIYVEANLRWVNVTCNEKIPDLHTYLC